MRFGLWNAMLSACSAIAGISVGFMIEKLFLEEWPWWAFGIMAIVFTLFAVFANWRLCRQEDVLRAENDALRKHLPASIRHEVYVHPPKTVGDTIIPFLLSLGKRPRRENENDSEKP